MIKKLYWYLFVYDMNQTATRPAAVGTNISRSKKMLHDLSWVVLFSYCLLTFNTLIPIAADIIAHTFWEKQHLAQEHKLHGSHHLQTDISKAEKQSGQSKSNTNPKSTSEDFTHTLCSLPSVSFPGPIVLIRVYAIHQYCPCFTYPFIDVPPPKNLVIV